MQEVWEFLNLRENLGENSNFTYFSHGDLNNPDNNSKTLMPSLL